MAKTLAQRVARITAFGPTTHQGKLLQLAARHEGFRVHRYKHAPTAVYALFKAGLLRRELAQPYWIYRTKEKANA